MSDFSTQYADRLGMNTTQGGKVWNAVFSDKENGEVEVQDFLNLMVAQLQNQDFMNPVDDTQFISQLAQFSSMTAMEEMRSYAQTTYATSLAGKNVTCARYSVSGNLEKVTGMVEKVDLSGDDFEITVGGKTFTLDQIMYVGGGSANGENGSQVDVADYKVTADYNNGEVKLDWPDATNDETIKEKLVYRVYYTEAKDADGNAVKFDTVEDIENNGELVAIPENSEDTLRGVKVEAGKEYYFTVVVQDGNGVKTSYKKASLFVKED